jgi:hypothetical protein
MQFYGGPNLKANNNLSPAGLELFDEVRVGKVIVDFVGSDSFKAALRLILSRYKYPRLCISGSLCLTRDTIRRQTSGFDIGAEWMTSPTDFQVAPDHAFSCYLNPRDIQT